MYRDYYWTADSWGSYHPPEDWEDIVTMANNAIDDFIEDAADDITHEDIKEYSETLWELYCEGVWPKPDDEE